MKQTAELTGSARFIELEERHGAHNYHPLDVVIAKAEGAWVWDVEGKTVHGLPGRLLGGQPGPLPPAPRQGDAGAGGAVTLTSRAFRNDQLGPFCEELTSLTGFHRVLPMNTGAEAVETPSRRPASGATRSRASLPTRLRSWSSKAISTAARRPSSDSRRTRSTDWLRSLHPRLPHPALR